MIFPKEKIFIILILSIILIVSYPLLLKGNSEYLWGPIKGNLRKIYYVSIFLVLVGFVPFSYYLLKTNDLNEKEIKEIFYLLILLISASWLWIIFSVIFAKKELNENFTRFIIVILLLIVSLSIYFLMKVVHKNNDLKKHFIIFIGLGYAFFHTFFLDFILWAYLVLFQ